jgi:hypothetical protein
VSSRPQEYNGAMAKTPRSRNGYRDRHDRGIRRPILSKLFKFGQTRSHGFEQYVETAFEYLKGIWVEELADVSWRVVDAPSINSATTEVPKWRVDDEAKIIVIYRIPTERFGNHSRQGEIEERLRVEEQVFEAIAELLDVDPWDLVPEYYNR